jgi:hypothetical protein
VTGHFPKQQSGPVIGSTGGLRRRRQDDITFLILIE